jgi:serine/threonine protein kinase
VTERSVNPCYLDRGTRVGAYEIVDQIDATGGFGCVWKVRRDGRVFALKMGRQRLAGLDAEDRLHYEERLDREIAALKTVHHTNIVRVHSFDWWPGIDSGFPYLVMDYVEGLQLYDWQAEVTPSLERICSVFERLASAIEHMHGLGVYHRDLKSQNILVRANGEPVIVDFGIARPRVALNVTQAATIGTITHYAPEYARFIDSAAFARGESFDWNATTDLYAVGYMLYEVLTGRPPYPYDVSPPTSEPELLLAIKNDVPPRPAEVNARVPAPLDDLAMALLEKEPARRPQSARELAKMLAEAREAARSRGEGGAWDAPFDLPRRRALGRHSAADEEDLVDAAPPLDGRRGAAEEAAATMTHGESALLAPPPENELPFDAPPLRATGGALANDEPARDDAVLPERDDPLPAALREAKARLAASAPRRPPTRLAIAGIILIAGVLGALLVVANAGAPALRPQTLLTETEARGERGIASPPVSSPVPTPAPAVEPATAEDVPAPVVTPDASPSDTKAIDEALAQEFGRPTVLRDGTLVMRAQPAVDSRDSREGNAPVVPSARIDREPPWLHRSTRLAAATPASHDGAPRVGVPLGAHMKAKLLTNLDSRTIASGPVEAVLTVPVLVRGQVVLPARTLAYGSASESSGRFNLKFSRLRLPDDTEVEFEGLALARDDGKPGLAAAQRIQHDPERQPGLGTRIAKGTGNLLLDTVTGGIGRDVARNAGQMVLNHEQATSSSDTALLLDRGVVFDIWVERAF